MPQINNSEITKLLVDGARLHPAADKIPDRLAESVVPVLDVTPRLARYVNFSGVAATGTSNTAVTAVTGPSDRDFYLTEITYHLLKDATCDAATGSVTLNVTIDGVTRGIATISHISLTAQDNLIPLNFSPPIKIDRGTTLRSTNLTFAAGVCRMSVQGAGYLVDL